MGTYQLHIVDHFLFKTFECFNSISVKGEGHSLQSLVLGTDADVGLHLKKTTNNLLDFFLTNLTNDRKQKQ